MVNNDFTADLQNALFTLVSEAQNMGRSRTRYPWAVRSGRTLRDGACKTFHNEYLFQLQLQTKVPFGKEQELFRTVWLDLCRWLLWVRFRSFPHDSRAVQVLLTSLSSLYNTVLYNPYCQYTMTFGSGCDQCPLVENKLVVLPKSLSLVAKQFCSCFLGSGAPQHFLPVIPSEDAWVGRTDVDTFLEYINSEKWLYPSLVLVASSPRKSRLLKKFMENAKEAD
jgi:hypothetical protein